MSEHFKRATGNLQIRSREPVVPLPNDVLLGRGRTRWGGNQMFDMEIQRNARRYGKAETKHDKTTIVRDIIRTVQKWGRFLDQESQQESHGNAAGSGDGLSSGDWYLATYVKIRKKVGQALRYQMDLLKLEPSIDGSNEKQSPTTTTSAGRTSSTGIPFDNPGGMAPTIPFLQQQGSGYTSTRKRVTQSQKHPPEHQTTTSSSVGDNSSESSTTSSTSFDVSLSALIAIEEEEARARGETSGQQQILITDEEILAVVLGYHDFYYNNTLGERTSKRQSVSDRSKSDAGADASTLFDVPITTGEQTIGGCSIDFTATPGFVATRSTNTTNGAEDHFSSDSSTVSLDVSLGALVAIEEEENEEKASDRSEQVAPQSEVLISDSDIIAHLGCDNTIKESSGHK